MVGVIVLRMEKNVCMFMFVVYAVVWGILSSFSTTVD